MNGVKRRQVKRRKQSGQNQVLFHENKSTFGQRVREIQGCAGTGSFHWSDNATSTETKSEESMEDWKSYNQTK